MTHKNSTQLFIFHFVVFDFAITSDTVETHYRSGRYTHIVVTR